MALQHRRRKATAEELAQVEKDMKAAQERLERERKESSELALENGGGEGGESGKDSREGRIQQTASTTAVPLTEDGASKVSASTSKTPESKAPRSGKGTPGASTKETLQVAKTPSRPDQGLEEDKGLGRTGGQQVALESRVISTPPGEPSPQSLIPLFSQERFALCTSKHPGCTQISKH